MRTKKALLLLLAAAFVTFGAAAVAQAANTATQTVNYEVSAIDAISVTPGTVSLAIADETLTDTDNTSTYDITTNGTNKKITAAISTEAMPAGLTLKVNLTAPTGATGGTDVDISNATTAVDVVTGIGVGEYSGLTIIYTLVATPSVPADTTGNRTVTFTLTDGA